MPIDYEGLILLRIELMDTNEVDDDISGRVDYIDD